MKFSTRAILAFSFVFLLGLVVNASADSFTVQGATTQRGDTITIDISYSGAAATSFDLNKVTFGPTHLELTAVAKGAATTDDGTPDPELETSAGWGLTFSSIATANSSGELDVALSKQVGGAGVTTGAIVQLTFAVRTTSTAAPYNDAVSAGDIDIFNDTVTPIYEVQVNGVNFTGTITPGTIKLIGIYQGDVTGDGDVTANDASYVLQAVADGNTAEPVTNTGGNTGFPVMTATPSWTSLKGRLATVVTPAIDATLLPSAQTSNTTSYNGGTRVLNGYGAFTVADVDPNDIIEGNNVTGAIAAEDASLILKFAVGIVTTFSDGSGDGILEPAPSLLVNSGNLFRTISTSERPDAQITVSLDLKDIPDLYAGELRLDYDCSLLRPVSVYISSDGAAPLMAYSTKAGDLGIAFASAYPILGGTLYAVFEAASGVTGRAEARIQATRLVLNRTVVTPDFAKSFAIEPYRFRLMANYPNPFNPETWIPFELSESADVTVRVFDVTGTLVRSLELGNLPQGVYSSRTKAAYWDGKNAVGEQVASGVYIYELTASKYRAMRRMVIAK